MRALCLAMLLNALVLSGVEAQIAAEYAAKGSPVALESDLEQAFVAFLEEEPGDPVSKETAQIIKDGSVPIRLAPIPEAAIGAVYDQTEHAILINLDTLASRYANGPVGEENRQLVVDGIRSSWERNPESLRAFVADMAPLLVHELRHALFARRLGPHPSSVEEEMACHAYEALFVRRRLRRNPDYLGFRQYDGLVRQYLGEPAGAGNAWWDDPFPFSPIHEIAAAVDTVNEKFPGRFRLNPLLWLHVRSLADGFAHFRIVFISTYPQEKFSLETDPKVILSELRAVKLAGKGRLHAPESKIHSIALRFWDDPERVRAALELFDAEWPRIESLIKEENAGAAPGRKP